MSLGIPRPVLQRPPYGNANTQIRQIGESLNLTEVRWNVDSEDWAGRSAAEIRSRVRAGLRPNSVIVVLLHDAWHAETPLALAGVIDDLRADGYCLAWIEPASNADVPGVGKVRLVLNEAPTSPPPGGTPITIRARGYARGEEMVLSIAGSDVTRWTLGTSFVDYNFTASSSVTTKDIRVRFVKDLNAPPVDRNLEVDWIQVGTTTTQTEDPAVTSLGTWTGANCSTTGKFSNQVLVCNGYFDFATVGVTGAAAQV